MGVNKSPIAFDRALPFCIRETDNPDEVGPGTAYPVGFTFNELFRIINVSELRISFDYSFTETYGDSPPIVNSGFGYLLLYYGVSGEKDRYTESIYKNPETQIKSVCQPSTTRLDIHISEGDNLTFDTKSNVSGISLGHASAFREYNGRYYFTYVSTVALYYAAIKYDGLYYLEFIFDTQLDDAYISFSSRKWGNDWSFYGNGTFLGKPLPIYTRGAPIAEIDWSVTVDYINLTITEEGTW